VGTIVLWTLWQATLAPYAGCFTQPGFRRFVEWVTGLALNGEEHTITQSLVGLDRTQDGKALEAFAEYGTWHEHQVEQVTAQLLEGAPGRPRGSGATPRRWRRTKRSTWPRRLRRRSVPSRA
jgi:hypothetical protein